MAGFFGWMPPVWRAQVRNNIDIADSRVDMSTDLDPREALRTRISARGDVMGTSSGVTLIADESTARLEGSARLERQLNTDTLVRADGSVDAQGRKRWSTGVEHSGERGTENFSLRGNGDVVTGDGDARFNHGGHAATFRGDLNSEGDWHTGFEGSHEVGDSTRLSESMHLSRDGALSLDANAEHSFNDSTSFHFGGSHDENSNSINAGGRFSGGGTNTHLDTSWSSTTGFRGTGGVSTRLGGIGLSGGVTHGLGETGLSSGANTHLAGLLGTPLDFNGSVDGALTFKQAKSVVLSSDEKGQIRRDALLVQTPGHQFIEYGLKARAGGHAGLSATIGAGSVKTGLSAGRTYEMSFVRLSKDERFASTPQSADWNVPKSSAQALKMLTGESFKIVGDMKHGVDAGGSLSANHGFTSARVQASTSLMLNGKTSTEVFRGKNNSVRLVTKTYNTNQFENDLQIKLGADFGVMGGAVNPIAESVKRAAQGALEDWVGAGTRSGWGESEKDNRLMDVRLDLSVAVVGKAYERALAGDWTQLRDLAKRGHPGVEMYRFVFTSIDEKTQSASHYAFGTRHGEVVTRTTGHSDVFSEGDYFGVTTELDVSSGETADWFKQHHYDVKDFSRHIRPGRGAALGALKAEDHWIEWSHEAREEFTSKDALLRGLGVARFLMRGESLDALKQYERRIKEVRPRTRMWLGPRNELSKTTLKIDVKLDDTGLDQIGGRAEKDYWNAYTQAWRSIYPDRSLPVWADPLRRRVLSTNGPMSDNTADFAELYRVEQLIERLQATPVQAKDQRNDWLRESLYENRGDEAWMAALALLAGREHIQVRVSVESSEDTDGNDHDVNLDYRGADFKIQGDVFGI